MSKHLLTRAQLQIGESIFAIMLILIVGMLVLIFFFNKSKIDYEDKLYEQKDLDALEVAKIVSSLSELTCDSKSNICMDYYKVLAFEGLLTANPSETVLSYYYDLFRDSSITVTSYEFSDTGTLTSQEHPLYRHLPEQQGASTLPTRTVSMPIYLRKSVNGEALFAVLTVERFHSVEGDYTHQEASP